MPPKGPPQVPKRRPPAPKRAKLQPTATTLLPPVRARGGNRAAPHRHQPQAPSGPLPVAHGPLRRPTEAPVAHAESPSTGVPGRRAASGAGEENDSTECSSGTQSTLSYYKWKAHDKQVNAACAKLENLMADFKYFAKRVSCDAEVTELQSALMDATAAAKMLLEETAKAEERIELALQDSQFSSPGAPAPTPERRVMRYKGKNVSGFKQQISDRLANVRLKEREISRLREDLDRKREHLNTVGKRLKIEGEQINILGEQINILGEQINVDGEQFNVVGRQIVGIDGLLSNLSIELTGIRAQLTGDRTSEASTAAERVSSLESERNVLVARQNSLIRKQESLENERESLIRERESLVPLLQRAINELASRQNGMKRLEDLLAAQIVNDRAMLVASAAALREMAKALANAIAVSEGDEMTLFFEGAREIAALRQTVDVGHRATRVSAITTFLNELAAGRRGPVAAVNELPSSWYAADDAQDVANAFAWLEQMGVKVYYETVKNSLKILQPAGTLPTGVASQFTVRQLSSFARVPPRLISTSVHPDVTSGRGDEQIIRLMPFRPEQKPPIGVFSVLAFAAAVIEANTDGAAYLTAEPPFFVSNRRKVTYYPGGIEGRVEFTLNVIEPVKMQSYGSSRTRDRDSASKEGPSHEADGSGSAIGPAGRGTAEGSDPSAAGTLRSLTTDALRSLGAARADSSSIHDWLLHAHPLPLRS